MILEHACVSDDMRRCVYGKITLGLLGKLIACCRRQHRQQEKKSRSARKKFGMIAFLCEKRFTENA